MNYHLPKPPSSPAHLLPLSFPVTRPCPCAFRHPQFPVGSALLFPSFTVPFSCSCLLHSRVFTLLPSLSYLHYVSFALLFTFLPAPSCPHFRAIFSSFAFPLFSLHFPGFILPPSFSVVFIDLHLPPFAFPAFNPAFTCPRPPIPSAVKPLLPLSSLLYRSLDVPFHPTSHFPFSFSIFHFPHPPS